MIESPLYYGVLAAGVLLLLLVAPPLFAARKGYKWQLWILSWGLGLVILAFLPYANRTGQSPGEQEKRRKTGNTIGLVLTLVNLVGLALSGLAVLVNVLVSAGAGRLR